MIDGGTGANNPVVNALVDALACFDVGQEDVGILSLGAGDVGLHGRRAGTARQNQEMGAHAFP